MPNLNLDYASIVTQREILLSVALVLGLSVCAVLLFSFTRSWRGLTSAWLVLLLGLGYGGLFGTYAYKSLNTSHVRPTNVERLVPAVESVYGVQVTKAQAKQLLNGTDAYRPGNQVSKFGTVVLTVHNRPYPDNTQPVTLIWNKTQWQLLILQDDGTYQSVQKVGETND